MNDDLIEQLKNCAKSSRELLDLNREILRQHNRSESLQPGWRYFECKACFYRWSEACRDHATPSISACKECGEANRPNGCRAMCHWPTDSHGNLI